MTDRPSHQSTIIHLGEEHACAHHADLMRRLERGQARRNMTEQVLDHIRQLDKGLDTCTPEMFDGILAEIDQLFKRIEGFYGL